MDDIEQAIDEELNKLNLDPSGNDFEESEDDSFTMLDGNLHAELPNSVLAYMEASRNRMNAFEQLILEDFEEKVDISSQELSHLNCNDNLINESDSEFSEDPIKWKEKVHSEIKEQVGLPKDIEPQNGQREMSQMSYMDDVTEHDICTESELQFNIEWRELEKRLQEEEKQRLAAQEEERELHLNSMREEEERKRRRQLEFEEELRRIEETTLIQKVGGKKEVHPTEDLQLEMDKQQELIRKLAEEMVEERRAFEDAQKEERRRTQELHCRAVTKIQAAFRGTLARQWSKTELNKKREEKKRLEEEKREWEKMKKYREEERRRIEEEERTQREETERRRADYERAKELERHRLEREHRLEQKKRKEEEDEERRREMERKRKEKQNNNKSVEEKSVKESSRGRRQEGDVETKETEKERRSRAEDECKRKEETEERREKENKGNEENVRKEDNNQRDGNGEEKTVKVEKNMMEQNEKSMNLEVTEGLNDRRPVTMSDKEKKRLDNGDLDSITNLSKLRKRLEVTTATPESYINAHQPLYNKRGISPVGSPGDTDHISVDTTQNPETDTTQPVSDFHGVGPGMDTRVHTNATDIELEKCVPEIRQLNSLYLPDSTEQKRLAWMMKCTPWAKLSMLNKRKGPSAQLQSQKRGPRRTRVPSLPPLSVDTILKTGEWCSIKQVTTVTLEDLPGCSLSTLSECIKLQTLTLRRCGLRSLDGLNQCAHIRYIDVQENSISLMDCGGMARLQVLLLGRNQVTNIHGLDGAENLQVLQLSHNNISRIGGLGSLKMLLRLSVDHNQLLSTRGLNEMYTLLHLDCSHNHLSHIEGLENCALLNTLDLRGNSLTELPVLQNHVLLRDLFLDDNLISSIHHLESYWLPLLQNLSVAQNSITYLIPLLDLVSLKTLDVSHNCLSDLQNVCLNLQGCTGLQEINLTGNPLQQDNDWRSLLLETMPGLIKLNNEQTGTTTAPTKGPGEQWSFQALCQAQQRKRDLLLQQQKMEISSAPSQHDAQLLASGHHAELFRLAVDQRYAHEYADSCVTEDPAPAAAADSSLHDVSDAPLSQRQSPEEQLQCTADWQIHNPENTKNSDLKLHSNDLQADCSEKPAEKEPVQAPNLKIAAAVVIQRRWRRCVMQRHGGLLSVIAKTNERSNIHWMEDSYIGRPELHNRDHAAVVIQAAWRGYALRRRLARTLAAAQITESDEYFEEVDMDEFIFDEKALEKDWITLHSDASPARTMPFSAQLPLPKQPKHAWSDREGTARLEQNMSLPHSSRNSTLSERSEKIIKEWGFTSNSTVLLMLKRASKMKGRKQQQKKLLDPSARLAMFRRHSNQNVSIETQRQTCLRFKDCFEVRHAKEEVYNALRAKERQNYKERTYQWLHPQAVHPHAESADLGQSHFLPEIDPDVLNGGRVQLVAIAGCRDGVDSKAKFRVDSTGISPPLNKHTQAQRHSAEHTKTKVPSPNRVSSAPTRKERISFRDNPVRRSGGWGGGKKAKLNK
ncbi:leucine-rich repeat and IQ domain-containing protein 1-like [Myxocyprinus asiaticus]|uniref:leucine-rich repeat and IQ domain-containing protein 1-like n=1 Tax=Myxocyprinus asiaticus TaxID=70543 RepID=UPI002221B3CB|nr:leucine-rich repeat and IQ domain-containing protein 1-like [Myxocyprinus asiaticus]